MRRKKRWEKPISKYAAERVHISTEVIRIEMQNVLINDKYKTVFYCPSDTNPEGRMCVAWGETRIVVGSKVELDGRFKDNVFLVWKITITNDKIIPFVPSPQMEELKKQVMRLRQR